MTDFNKTFALISGIALCVLAGLFAFGYAYGATACGIFIGIIVLVATVVWASYLVTLDLWGR
jgi:hypothetical protein